MKEKTWFAEAALKVESFYSQHASKIDRAAGIGRIWGTRVEDLKSPAGVAGRILRTLPEVIQLARAFTQEPNAIYAEAILAQELPYIVLGSAMDPHDEAIGGSTENLNSSHVAGLLRGIASVLTVKSEEAALFSEGGKTELAALKVYLGEGVVMGLILRPSQEYLPVRSPLRSSVSPEATLARLNQLWEERGIVGLEIRSNSGDSNTSLRRDFSECEITRVETTEDLVVGSEFANNYLQIAERVQRFEKAGYKRNLMLLGPPGCGKTSIAQQIAQEIGRFTINVESSLLASAALIQVLTYFFRDVVLICDDFDRYHGDTQSLLASLERTGSSLIVTCNTVYGFDKAAIRVGRIDEIIDVPKPDLEMRRRLFRHFFDKTASDTPYPDPTQLEAILKRTDGFTPAEMREVVKCYIVLGFTDSKLEIDRLKKQSKLAESLWFKVDWMNKKEEGEVKAAERVGLQRVQETLSVEPGNEGDEDDEDDDW